MGKRHEKRTKKLTLEASIQRKRLRKSLVAFIVMTPLSWLTLVPMQNTRVLAATTVFAGGSGTTADPYIIATAAQLAAMASDVNAKLTDPQGTSYATATYDLGANIDLSATTWTSISNFAGTFDGNGYRISNLSSSGGLFESTTSGATIENVALTNVKVTTSGSYLGALVGVNRGDVTNSYSSGSVQSSGGGNVGALIGENFGTISYSYSTGTVSSAGNSAGGLVGYNNATIEDSSSSASVAFTASGLWGAGGLVGINYGKLTDVYATGSVTAQTTNAEVGGLVGDNPGHITDAYATGRVTASASGEAAGLVGQEYYTGSSITDSFWDTTTTNQSSGVGGGGASPSTIQLTAETDTNMKLASTFSSWPSVWTATNGHYPYFGLQMGTQHLPSATVGVLYIAYLKPKYATGTAPYTWSLTGSLPQGLSFNSSGEISGIPTVSGTANFSAQVKDSLGATATINNLSIVTGKPNPPGAPTGLGHSSVGKTGWTEYWSSVSGSTGYNVYINGTKVTTSPVTSTSYNVTGETAGTIYSVMVTAVNAGGESAPSSPDSVTTPPGAPTGLTHSNLTQTGWTESWGSVTGATGYNVYINGTKVTSSPVTATSYVVSGESAGTTYHVTVTAVNAGGESAMSTADTVTTLPNVPGVPTSLTHSNLTQTGWTESWSSVTGATGYNVYINGTKVTSSPVSSTSYPVTGESAGATYHVTVTAVNAGGESATSTADSVTTVPGVPTSLSHSSVTQTGWTESWSSVSGTTGYNVYINGTKVTSSPVAGTSYVVSGESAGTTYHVTVTAVNAGGESAASTADSVTTVPGVPTSLSHSSVTQTGWTESWSSVSGATGYNVYINGTKVTSSPVAGTSYVVSGESAGTTYHVTVTAVNAGGESAMSTADSVTTVALVNAETPSFSTEPQATQSVTAGSPATALTVAASVTDGGTVTYQWYKNTTNSNTGGTAITAATSASYTPATASAGTTYYYAVATNTNNSVNGTKTATSTSTVAKVTVNALVNAVKPTFTTEPQAAQSVTAGSPATALTVAASVTDGGTVTYQWYKNTTNSNTGGTAVTAATSASYTPATASAGTTYYYAVATNTNRSVNGAKTATATSSVAKVTVNALVNAVKPTFTTEPQAAQSVTAGSAATALTVAASVTDSGTVTYQWYKNITNSNTGGTAITGATSASYTPPTTSVGTTYYYAVATNTNRSVNGAKTATAISSVAKVTVNALVNAATPKFTTEPQATQGVTAGSAATALTVAASVSDGGAVTYQWYSNTTNSSSGGTAIAGATSASYTPPTTSAGTTYYYAVATNTNSSVNGAKTATATSSVAKVTVNALVNAATPTFTTEPQTTQSVTAGSTAAALKVAVSVSDGGTVTYQWYSNTTNSNSGGTAITGATSASYMPPSTSVGTMYYYAVVTNTNNGVNGAKTATATSDVAKVTVNVVLAPMGLSHSSITQTGWTESWNSVSGAAGYNVYVNGTKVNASPVTGSSYAVTGEKAGASYKVTVTTVGAGAQSAASAADTVQTLSVLSVSTGSSLPSVLQGTDYKQSIQVTGGASPYTFSVTKGALPTGVTLQSDGNLVGTPSSNGSYNFTVQVTDKNGNTAAKNMSLYVIPAAPAGFLPKVETKQVVGGSGVTLTAGNGSTNATLVVATGTFANPLQMDVTSGTVPNALVPKGQKVIAAYGVNFDAQDAPSKPLIFTLRNAEITPQSKVYKIVNGKIVPISAVVTQGKAVITFTTDPSFVVLKSQSQPQPQTKTVPGATKPVTGFGARPWGAGGVLSILTGGLLLWWQRRRKHHEE
ncbi:S-layer family protein [Alicyclobacillus sp. SO9]|uniref:beta strand repeat-containing protein n=1 Tax=Alicyclobacillus sp. SO9 TaxID=2665646 RepID=UPI0018E6EBC0|nr:GLUG motif-containing protein [Alicyclobacillus sp. SO9]QQE80032.1 hypothetical protein GI364_06055 [Alicyclobacillus sp. SO9]